MAAKKSPLCNGLEVSLVDLPESEGGIQRIIADVWCARIGVYLSELAGDHALAERISTGGIAVIDVTLALRSVDVLIVGDERFCGNEITGMTFAKTLHALVKDLGYEPDGGNLYARESDDEIVMTTDTVETVRNYDDAVATIRYMVRTFMMHFIYQRLREFNLPPVDLKDKVESLRMVFQRAETFLALGYSETLAGMISNINPTVINLRWFHHIALKVSLAGHVIRRTSSKRYSEVVCYVISRIDEFAAISRQEGGDVEGIAKEISEQIDYMYGIDE